MWGDNSPNFEIGEKRIQRQFRELGSRFWQFGARFCELSSKRKKVLALFPISAILLRSLVETARLDPAGPFFCPTFFNQSPVARFAPCSLLALADPDVPAAGA
jgi:hypothetical protein